MARMTNDNQEKFITLNGEEDARFLSMVYTSVMQRFKNDHEVVAMAFCHLLIVAVESMYRAKDFERSLVLEWFNLLVDKFRTTLTLNMEEFDIKRKENQS